MITILARDDLLGFFLVTAASDPWSFAEELGKCHLFRVKVKATLEGDLDQLLNGLQNCHMGNQWFRCSLQHIVAVWAKVSDNDEHMDIEPTASESSVVSQPPQTTALIPTCLTHCAVDKAPLASHLREDLIQLLGKVEVKPVLRKLTAKTARTNGKPARIYFFEGKAVTLKA